MAFATNNNVLPQLTTDNFNNWKFRIAAILEEKQIKETLTKNVSEINDEKQKEAFKLKDAKARSTIIQCISDKHLDIVKDAKTAQEMMEALERIFERKSVFTKLTLRRKLLTLKHKNGQKLDEHFLKFDGIIRELESLGSKIEETEKICYLLLSLTEEYEAIITAIETSNVDIKMDFVKAKLLDQELKMQNKNNYTNENQESSFKVTEITCFRCGHKGHKSYECKSKHSEQFRRNTSRGRGNFSFRSRGTYRNKQERANQAENELSFVALNSRVSNELNVFIIDSGATQHLVSDRIERHMTMIEELDNEVTVHVANGEMMVAEKKGVVRGYCQGRKISIPALIVKGMKHNLLSVGQLTRNGHKVIFQEKIVSIAGENFEIECTNRNNLYTINIEFHENALISGEMNDPTLWHRRLGHLNYGGLKILGLPFSKEKCGQCIEGKSTRRHFNSQRKKTNNIGELIHSDISGPINPTNINGENYFQVIIDDYSHFTVVRLLKNKNESEQNIIDFIKLILTQHGKRTKRIRLDNGGEFTSHNFKKFCKHKGIRIEYTLPYSPQQNGTAERMNRTLVDKVRTKFAETKLPKYLWGEAIQCSAYELNRSPTKANYNGTTPSQIWHKSKDLSKLRVFGSKAWMVKLPKENKLEPRAKNVIMVGYCGGGYRLWNSKENKIIQSTDVIFDEFKTEYKENIANETTQNKIEYMHTEDDAVDDKGKENYITEEDELETDENPINEQLKSTRSGREINQPKHLNDYEIYSAYCLLMNTEVPISYNEAMKCNEWKQAIENELRSHTKMKTWSTVTSAPGSKPIDTRWVFQRKEDGVKKARLVAKGFQLEEDGLHSMYTPVARMATVRMILGHAVNNNWKIKQMDIPTAFLNGKVENEIYIKVPEGVNEEKGTILKLNKALYGLREASKCWNNRINEVLVLNGLRRSQHDFCLYIGENVWIVIFVDDIIITGEENKTRNIGKLLEKEFEAKDMGEVSRFLGMKITRNGIEMKITQELFIQKLLENFGMTECKGSSIPMEVGLQLNANKEITKSLFRRLVGSLMYLATTSRPDIMFAVAYISRWCDKPTTETWAAGKRILRYLKETPNVGLVYGEGDEELVAYSDADWGGDKCDRKSVSGSIIMFGGKPVSWFSRKQGCVALSTAEAEYISAAASAQELVYLKGIRSELNESCVKNAVLCMDNTSALSMIKTYENSKRSKHIDIKNHFIKDLVNKNVIMIKYVCSQDNIADFMTKALCKDKFVKCRNEASVL